MKACLYERWRDWPIWRQYHRPHSPPFREHGVSGRIGKFPSLHYRKEGWLRHQRKFGEATEADAAGVVFLLDSSENHPGLAISGCLRYFLNRSATLLAVMQGGE